ncbi:hypothetical protein [Protofrankia symbiont of Coriaria ruscifolia]|uniref:Uncharacterized protein n=1 Tax=Candidatus Protofrankia californiensis TaxID=1839754 RepID=A0A1C3P0M2_9ACTN|nr:hypothetical protein [Protofrankia symbiont of Coriaria ruscifolia]SBW23351.1 hypothetical protein FDG2_3747 [Candidatus Protofrankia californiensis]
MRTCSLGGRVRDLGRLAGTTPVELLKTLAAPIYFRLLITAEPIGDATAEHAAQIALAAAHAGVLRGR